MIIKYVNALALFLQLSKVVHVLMLLSSYPANLLGSELLKITSKISSSDFWGAR